MREGKKKRLRDAWFGPLTAAAIARANALSESTLRRFWDEERAHDRLPPKAPRPYFAQQSKRAQADDIELDDDAPIGEPNPTYEAPCDALLAALRLHHLDEPHRHRAPVEWLRQDHPGARAPSREIQYAQCRAFDGQVYR